MLDAVIDCVRCRAQGFFSALGLTLRDHVGQSVHLPSLRCAMVVGLSAMLCMGCAGSARMAAEDRVATLELSGPQTPVRALRFADFSASALTVQTDRFASRQGIEEHTYRGVPLWDLLKDVGLGTDLYGRDGRREGLLDAYVVVQGEDGDQVVYSVGELHPDFGHLACLWALRIDRPEGDATGQAEPLSTTAPGDLNGGRYVRQPMRIALRRAPWVALARSAQQEPDAASFRVLGAVERELTLDAQGLRDWPMQQYRVGTTTYNGVSLWTLLREGAGLRFNSHVKNPLLSMYVLATGEDGYRAVLSLGEIAPEFGHQPIMVGFAADQTLGARLSVPGDTRHGRWVSHLNSLVVFSASAEAMPWPAVSARQSSPP